MKDSQLIMYKHSEVKVQLLSLYIEKYINILSLSQYIDYIILFDLFCGEGVYENGGKGSPIILLEAISKLPISNNFQNTFQLYFNDIDEYKIEKLKAEINKRGLRSRRIESLTFSSLDYKKILPSVLVKFSGFKKARGFIFIDPYGYKDVRISHIKELLRPRTTEVLLFLPTHFMFRFEEKGTPESLKEFISELIPESEWPKSSTGLDFIERLKDGFKKHMGDDKYVDTFIITREKNQFFCLFFFTSHIYGFDRMLEAKWQIDEEEGRGWKYNTANDLFSSIDVSPNTYKLENELKQFLSGDFRTNAEIYEFTLNLGYLPKHSLAVLSKFQNENILEVKSCEPIIKGAFYLSYKNWKRNPEKIKVRLK